MSKRSSSKKKVQSSQLRDCTAIIKVYPGITSLFRSLSTCLECRIGYIQIIDGSYHPSNSIYQDKETKQVLSNLRSQGFNVEIKREFRESTLSSDLLVEIPWNCYMTESAFLAKWKEVKENYKTCDRFAYAPTTLLPFSPWNGLIYLLFILDFFRSLPYRQKLYQSKFVIFTTIHRQMGHPYLPKETWFWQWSRNAVYQCGDSNVSLEVPNKMAGLPYFLHLCQAHSSVGLLGWAFSFLYAFMIAFPFYNWMPIIRYWVAARDPFDTARLVMWIIHGAFASWMISTYFQNIEKKQDKKQDYNLQLYLIHTTFGIPLIAFPIFCLLWVYGTFLYRGNRLRVEPVKTKDVDLEVTEFEESDLNTGVGLNKLVKTSSEGSGNSNEPFSSFGSGGSGTTTGTLGGTSPVKE